MFPLFLQGSPSMIQYNMESLWQRSLNVFWKSILPLCGSNGADPWGWSHDLCPSSSSRDFTIVICHTSESKEQTRVSIKVGQEPFPVAESGLWTKDVEVSLSVSLFWQKSKLRFIPNHSSFDLWVMRSSEKRTPQSNVCNLKWRGELFGCTAAQ